MSETAVPNEEFLADLEEAMRDVVDPELGINVVDLGLVYGFNVEEGESGKVALIDMTLTSAACPLTDAGRCGPGQRDQDQLGVEPAVGPRQNHRGRPRAAARFGLHRLAELGAPLNVVAQSGFQYLARRVARQRLASHTDVLRRVVVRDALLDERANLMGVGVDSR
jgi:hypothetical protein